MKSGWSSRLVRKKVGAAAHAEALVPHQAQDLGRVPHVDEVDRVGRAAAAQERVEHPDEVPDRRPVICGGPPFGNM